MDGHSMRVGRVSRRRLLQWTAGAVGAATVGPLLAGCAGLQPGGANSGKNLNIVVGLDPGVLDPHGTNAAVSEATAVFGQIFETLVDVSYANNKVTFTPVLATEWKSV